MKDLKELKELLAALAHEMWSGWMRYLFSKSVLQSDGSVVIPSSLVQRWKRQIGASYQDLPEKEKDSDRKEAKQMLAVVYGSDLWQ